MSDEFSATYYLERQPEPIKNMSGESFTVQIENRVEGQLAQIDCDYDKNTVKISTNWTDTNSVRVITWNYSLEGDEAGRAGRIGRWFIGKLEEGEGEKMIDMFHIIVENMACYKFGLDDCNVLWGSI